MVVTITTRMMCVSIVHKQCHLHHKHYHSDGNFIFSISVRYNVWWERGYHFEASISKHRKVSAISICFSCHESWVSKVQLDLPTAWLPLAVCWTHGEGDGETDCLHMTQWDFQTVYCFPGSACYTSHCHRHFGHHNSCYHWLVMCWSRC